MCPCGGGNEFAKPVSLVNHAEPSIKGLELSAKTIFVATGADLKWTNDDDVLHNITSRDGWFNADVQPGESFTWQPEAPGIYRYFCRMHESIQGTIFVGPGGAVAPTYFDGKPISHFFADTCGGCQGQDRQGGTGPALIPGRLAQDDTDYFDLIANGRPGTIMPAWSPLGISNEEIWGLIGYIRSEPSVESIVWDVEPIRASLEILRDETSLPDSTAHSGNLDNLMLVTEREIDVENAVVVDRIATGDTPHPGSGAVREAGGKQYGATAHAGEGKVTVWNLVTNEIIGSVPTGGPGLFIRSHDLSPYVWAGALFGDPANTITAFGKEPPFSVVGTIAEGEMTLHPEFTADGRFVYISDWKGNMIRVYDAEKLTKVAEISDLVTPTGIFNTERRHDDRRGSLPAI